MNPTYDRLAAGERLRSKRTLLGFTQDEMAEKIDRATKYYADIERGSCGMSIETLMNLSTVLNMPMDYIIYGKESESSAVHTEEVSAIISMLDGLDSLNQKYAKQLLKLFLASRSPLPK